MASHTLSATTTNPEYAIGIDIGGTGIKGALVDLATGDLVSDRFRAPTPQPSVPEAVVEAVGEVVGEVVGNIDGTWPVGVSFPGVMRNGVVITSANLDNAWHGMSLNDAFSPVLGDEFVTLNDADAAGLAEMHYGAGAGHDGLVLMVTLGTGIGTALIYDGVLIPNSELGHIEVDGRDAEERAAASARKRHDMSWPKWGRKVGKYLRTLEYVLRPDLFVIGGGVSKKSEKWLDYVETDTPIAMAKLQNNAGIVGTAWAASKQAE